MPPPYPGPDEVQPTWKLRALIGLAKATPKLGMPDSRAALANKLGFRHHLLTHYFHNKDDELNLRVPRKLLEEICDVYQMPLDLYLAESEGLNANEQQVIFQSSVRKHWLRDFKVRRLSRGELQSVYSVDRNKYEPPNVEGDGTQSPTNNITLAQFEIWYDACPNGFICAFRRDQPFFGIGVFPVTPAWSNAFLEKKNKESDLDRETIIEGAKLRTHWYFSGFSGDEEIMEQYKSIDRRSFLPFFKTILGCSILFWIEIWAPRIGRAPITVVAEAATRRGHDLLDEEFRWLRPPEEDTAEPQTKSERFYRNTSLLEIRHLLLEDPYFSTCDLLHEKTLNSSQLNFLLCAQHGPVSA